MEFQYNRTVVHNGVVFYVSEDGNRAYFICGGCVISIPRPRERDCDESASETLDGEIAKFGLTVRGVGPYDRVVANYIRSEIRRKGAVSYSLGDIGDEGVFLDVVDLLNQFTGATERDILGSLEVEVRDQCLAEYFVTLTVSSGLILTTGRDIPAERTIRLFETPVIVNAVSGFVYECNPHAFSLVHARLTELPSAVTGVTDGLFDRVPCTRPLLRGPDSRTDVIITGSKAAGNITIGASCVGGRWRGAKKRSTLHPKRAHGNGHFAVGQDGGGEDHASGGKRATVSEFVQVKYIPRTLDIWDYGSESPRPSNSLASLWTVFCRVDAALAADVPRWSGLEEDVNEARARLADAINATFGDDASPFIGASVSNDVSPGQKFVACQYLLARWALPNCYPVLNHLCRSYASDDGAPPEPPLDGDALADTVNSLYRDAMFVGSVADIALSGEPKSLTKRVNSGPADPITDAYVRNDADCLLELAEETSDAFDGTPDDARELRVEFIMESLGYIYGGNGVMLSAIKMARSRRTTVTLAAAEEVMAASAFGNDPVNERGACYMSVLLDTRMRNAGLID